MADAQPRKGEEYYVEFDGQAITVGLRAFDPGLGEVSADTTAAGDALETQGLIRETIAPTMTVLVDKSATGILIEAVMAMGNTGNLIWGPRGNTSGYPKWGISARVAKSLPVLDHGDEQILEVEFANVGRAWVYNGRSATF